MSRPAVSRFSLATVLLAALISFTVSAHAAAPSVGIGLPPIARPDSISPPPPSDSSVFDPSQWRFVPERPCGRDSVALVFSECGCGVTLVGAEKVDSSHTVFRMKVNRGIVCIRCEEDSLVLPLGRLPEGGHTIEIKAIAEVTEPDGSVHVVEDVFQRSFYVFRGCPPPPPPTPPPPPPPPPDSLPHVSSIVVGQRCATCPPVACAGRPIPVSASGATPDNCTMFAGIKLLPSPVVGPEPQPPIVRILFQTNSCLGRPCIMVPQPWAGEAKLPELPAGSYRLLVESAVVDGCTDSLEVLGRRTIEFVVAESCSVQVVHGCLVHDFGRVSGTLDCDATIAPDRPAELTFRIGSGVALAALQAELHLSPEGALAITALEPIGPARDMHLVWHSLPDGGASFVLIAERGAPIPPANPPVEVLHIRIEGRPGVPIPESSWLYANRLIGSDSTVTGIYECPGIYDGRDFLRGARICRVSPCDFNADGSSDVRDLVVMVHCLHGDASCSGRPRSDFDCDRNGTFELADVLCCAGVILRGSAPDSVAARTDPAVRVELGDPVGTADGADLPLSLYGTDHLGAARLDLRYPSDRYEVASVDFGAGAAWLGLHETTSDRVTLGLIALESVPVADHYPDGHTIQAMLHLRLKAGARAGGEVTLVGTQFSGPDGAAIEGSGGNSSRPLVVEGVVALSTPRPNPFSQTSHFSVSLVRPGDLEVGVYDLAGRHVALLFRGLAAAGTRDLEWRRRNDDGVPVAHGIYFYRAVAEGKTVTRKVLVMGGN